LIINEGRIVAEDTPQNLTSRLQSSERVLLRVARPQDEAITRLGRVPGVTGVTAQADGVYEVNCDLGSDKREDLAAAVVQGGWGLLEMRTSSLTLEEVFLKLTTKEEETDA
ncbi:MAG: ABC transporter ATP-binding protein, partial [Chloroflexota bacterium]|nr:ABC transporter ATP-binding protein [Chloroflexota bacterium]